MTQFSVSDARVAQLKGLTNVSELTLDVTRRPEGSLPHPRNQPISDSLSVLSNNLSVRPEGFGPPLNIPLGSPNP